jgi:RimJ/RimL family protein N-acetyltransferase
MRLSGDLSQIAFESERLTLKSFTPADAAESFAELNDRIAKYMSWNRPASEEEYRTIWQGSLAAMKAGTDLQLVVRAKATGEFIGSAGLHSSDDALLETGLWIKESAQRHGYGREVVAAVVDWASARFGPAGFRYPVVDENAPSRGLAEALGGKITGKRQRQKPGDEMRTLLLYVLPPSA